MGVRAVRLKACAGGAALFGRRLHRLTIERSGHTPNPDLSPFEGGKA